MKNLRIFPVFTSMGLKISLAAAVTGIFLACVSTQVVKTPGTEVPGGPSPSQLYKNRTLHQPPPLSGSGEEARKSVLAFIDWASFSTVDEQEDARNVIAAARDNDNIAKALAEEAERARMTDHSRALIVLSILGEMRNPRGEEYLRNFLHLPFPEKGTLVDGEIVEQTALGTLQAKAVDGLAYLRSESGDKEVLWAVANHPSRIVRAEAINAYLWNHEDSGDARTVLRRYVRKGEEIFLDRVRRETGENAESFNHKLKVYLETHPQVIPPLPQHNEGKTQQGGSEEDKRSEYPANQPPIW